MTSKEQSLEGLIERVKAATGPDRELDADVLINLGCVEEAEWDIIIGKDVINKLAGRTYSHPAPVTASIDAALALVERVLPGWRYDIHSPRFGTPFEGVLMDGDSASRRIVVAHAATASLAIILALLTAMQDQNNHG